MMDVITYPCWDWSSYMLIKGASEIHITIVAVYQFKIFYFHCLCGVCKWISLLKWHCHVTIMQWSVIWLILVFSLGGFSNGVVYEQIDYVIMFSAYFYWFCSQCLKCDEVDLFPLQWHHNGHNSISNHQPHDCLLDRLFRHRSKKTSKLRVTGLCAGNSPGTCEFPAQMASNTENVSIWWCHHVWSQQSLYFYRNVEAFALRSEQPYILV